MATASTGILKDIARGLTCEAVTLESSRAAMVGFVKKTAVFLPSGFFFFHRIFREKIVRFSPGGFLFCGDSCLDRRRDAL
jgi:hypothetical protein